MTGAKRELSYFESRKKELIRTFPGQFAVICGRRLVGVHRSLAAALAALSERFDAGDVPAGAPILITEIAQGAVVRVLATPGRQAADRAAPTNQP